MIKISKKKITIPVSPDDLFGCITRHLEEPGTGKQDRVIGFGSIGHHKCLLERRQRILQVLRKSRDSSEIISTVGGGVARAPHGIIRVPSRSSADFGIGFFAAGVPRRHNLWFSGLRISFQHQTPFSGSLRRRADFSRSLLRRWRILTRVVENGREGLLRKR